jgi:hypothetical protein
LHYITPILMKILLPLFLLVSSIVSADETSRSPFWLHIDLVQTAPYRDYALLVIDEGYDANKRSPVTLPFSILEGAASATLQIERKIECKETNPPSAFVSHHLAIYKIELLNGNVVQLNPKDFENLPSEYKLEKQLIAHRPELHR